MKRTGLYLLFILCACLQTAAQPIDETTARERATALLGSRTRAASDKEAAPRWHLAARNEASFLFADGNGAFVLTAADNRLPAVLGYGERCAAATPPALKELMGQYARLLQAEPAGQEGDTFEPIAPLLTTVRHQKAPYNNECPRYVADGTTSEERCVTGCVATALEQVLTYHRRTYTLHDTLHGWKTDHYAVPDVLPGESVDSRLIQDDYAAPCTKAQIEAVARLSFWLGLAARMNWGLSESGASSRCCIEPLQQAFGLGYVFYADSYHYAPQDWTDMLQAELRAGRPVYYAANTMRLGGHAFVLDGLDEKGLYHVNWGYDGNFDGYFDLRVLYSGEPAYDRTPAGCEHGFICNHEAIFLHPDALDVSHPDTLRRTGQEIEVKHFRLEETPMLTAYTPATITLHNQADYALTTPFELFTNLPADTAFFEQGDYVALLGTTLGPDEEKTFRLHLRFDEGGHRILRLSADDVHYVTLDTIDIAPYAYVELQFSAPAMEQQADGVQFVSCIRNPSHTARAGKIVTYQLYPTDDPRFDIRSHAHYFYLAPDEEMHDTVRFVGLEAGRRYELVVRCPWPIVQRLSFTFTPSTGLTVPVCTAPEKWFGIDGRPVTRPQQPGIYIRGRKKILK